MNDANQQHVNFEQDTTKKTLEKTLRDISKQVLETKYTLNFGQLLWVTLDIKHYIPNSVPSKLVLPKSVIVLVAIDHQMVVIQVQVRKNLLKMYF